MLILIQKNNFWELSLFALANKHMFKNNNKENILLNFVCIYAVY